ncbi:hypothetical protein [Ramlibacter algicola]|uniref:UrcA family protein n=1 Tax=Ramlibacter algicola TaxID=2795217 RepID=A0A934Q2L0_9BURK|nr:hypothetical protein [Ramlibacter algicola]MBK0393973.1 hypothetical protein [Ramlibacter algicola]
MNLNPLRLAVAAAAFCAGTAPAADRAPPAHDAVSVDLSRLAPAMAQRMNLDESRMPLSLLVPAAVAAEACAVPVARIAPAGCQASVHSGALDRVLAARMEADAPSPDEPARARP